MSYKAYVVKIENIRNHINADRLRIATVFGNDVVVGLDVEVGDIMLYFPTDGQLSEKFAITNNLVRAKDEFGNSTGGYLDPEKRNIRAIRLRGEKSDGLLMPLSSLYKVVGEDYVKKHIKVGDAIDVINGIEICRKYIPIQKIANNIPKNVKKLPSKNVYPLFEEHVSTSQLAYSLRDFKVGDSVTISLKLHGTSGRTSYTILNKEGLIDRLLKKFNIKTANKWGIISGTRRVILYNFNGGYHRTNEFRRKYHDIFDGKLQKGESVYYEIVGYTEKDKPIMSRVNNKKLQDKSFLKQYGETTTFNYGCENGESEIYVYRMNITNEDGVVIEYPTWLAQLRCEQMGVKHVPVLSTLNFVNQEQLMHVVNLYEDGADPIGINHIREGVIVRVENREKFTAYKHKNFAFKVLEGIIKEEAVEPDMEEAQDLENIAYV